MARKKAIDQEEKERNADFGSAISALCEEKGISKEKVLETVEAALAAAYKKDYGKKGQNIRAEFDELTGKTKFFLVKEVVDVAEDAAGQPVFEVGQRADGQKAFDAGRPDIKRSCAGSFKVAHKQAELDADEENPAEKAPLYKGTPEAEFGQGVVDGHFESF